MPQAFTLRKAKWPLQSDVTCSDLVLICYICCKNRFPLITALLTIPTKQRQEVYRKYLMEYQQALN